jgi:hypothetical protein
VLPPSPPGVERHADIKNVVLDTFNGGVRRRKSSKRGKKTRRKNTRHRKRSKKRH